MAGWKLRKDKLPAELSGADPETAAPAAGTAEAVATEEEPLQEPISLEPAFFETAPELPDFETDTELHFADLDFDSDGEALENDGPLTLVDYSEPAAEATQPEHHAHIYEAPAYEAPAYEALTADTLVFALPPAEQSAEEDTEDAGKEATEEENAFEPLHSSSWLSSDFSTSIPAVAPFVLDAPPTAAAPIAAPQLVVHFGRLSAAFDVAKDVTTIGRPDSTLHYYPDVEIDLDDAVSRRHAEVVKRGDGYYLVDTGSTNGTRLNGDLLMPHQERRLAHGDRIRIGDRTEIVFEQ